MRTNCPDCVWHTSNGGRMIHGLTPCEPCRRATLHDSAVNVDPVFEFHRRIRDYRMAVVNWEYGGKKGPPPTVDWPEIEDPSVELPKMEWPDTGPLCFRCKKDMRESSVHGKDPYVRPDGEVVDSLDNECNLLFTGGYGSFIDTGLGHPWPLVVICHECAHQLCEWLGIDPRLWHTHSVYGGQHADHHDNTVTPPGESEFAKQNMAVLNEEMERGMEDFARRLAGGEA